MSMCFHEILVKLYSGDMDVDIFDDVTVSTVYELIEQAYTMLSSVDSTVKTSLYIAIFSKWYCENKLICCYLK